MAEVKEECGVCGIYLKDFSKNKKTVPGSIDLMLTAIQRRGQAGTGIAVYRKREDKYGKTLRGRKKVLKVDEFFGGDDNTKRETIMSYYMGVSGIGHVRYGTSGTRDNSRDSLQPFLRRHGRIAKRFGICYNGNLTNYSELEAELLENGYDLEIGVDTEIIMHLFSLALKNQEEKQGKKNFEPDFFELSKDVALKMDGAYSLLSLFGNGDLGVIRDSQGFKPLYYGQNKYFYAVASETISLRQVGINDFKIVEPGSAMLFSQKGVRAERISDSQKKAHCHFEAVYFEDDGSHFENVPVYDVRYNLGIELAKIEPLAEEIRNFPKDFAIVPVPISPVPAAEAFSYFFGLAYKFALKKISSRRGFINPQQKREYLIERIYDVNPQMVNSKRVILIDDSVVRAETIKKVVRLIREARAKEVHVRVTEPPIKHPCFYGIDFATYSELAANKYSQENLETSIAQEIGADSFVYQRLEGLEKSLVVSPDSICKACLIGEYPTSFGKVRAREAREACKGVELFL